MAWTPHISAAELGDRALTALARRDVESFLELVHPDVEFRPLLAAVDGGVYKGHEAVRGWLEDVYEAWEGYQPAMLASTELHERVMVAEILIRLRGRRSDVVIETRMFGVAVRDEDLRRIESWSFFERQEEAHAAGEAAVRRLAASS